MAANPTIRNPEVDPEVNLEADHLMGPAVLLPQVTESILVTGLMLMTEVEIKTRSDHGPYYSDDHDRYCDDKYYDLSHSRYYDWGYDRRYDDRGRYWSPCRSPSHRSPNHSRPDDHRSDDLRDRHPWGDPGFRDWQDHSGSFDNQRDLDSCDDRHCRSPPPDSRDHHRGSPHHDKYSKSPVKP